MTERELRFAFQKLDSKPELSLVNAGKCRHELDWLYGINLSRLLTESASKQGRGYATLSTGRVQGPTLGFVVEREEEISCFIVDNKFDNSSRRKDLLFGIRKGQGCLAV
jgi:DNA topoisomerase-1